MTLSPLVTVILLALFSFIMVVLAFWYILRLPSWLARRASLDARRLRIQEVRTQEGRTQANRLQKSRPSKQRVGQQAVQSTKRNRRQEQNPALHAVDAEHTKTAISANNQVQQQRRPQHHHNGNVASDTATAKAPKIPVAGNVPTTLGRSGRGIRGEARGGEVRDVQPDSSAQNYGALKEKRQSKKPVGNVLNLKQKKPASGQKPKETVTKISNDTFRGANAIKPSNKLGKSVPKPKLLTRTLSDHDHAQISSKEPITQDDNTDAG